MQPIPFKKHGHRAEVEIPMCVATKKVVNPVVYDDLPQHRFPFRSDAYLASHGVRVFSPTEAPEFKFSQRKVDGLLVMQVAVGYCSLTWTPRPCVDYRGELALLVIASGEVALLHDSTRSLSCKAGNLLLLPMDSACSLITYAKTRINIVVFPSVSPIAKLPIVSACIGDCFRPSDTFPLRMLSSYVEALTQGDHLTNRVLSRTAQRHINDLITLIFSDALPSALHLERSASVSMRLGKIVGYIRANMHDPDLTIHSVAKHHNISKHYVRKLFYEANTSFTGYITELRLSWAHQRLTSAEAETLRIADVAFQAGFNNLGWFNRAFKRKFGLTPSALRSQCRAQLV